MKTSDQDERLLDDSSAPAALQRALEGRRDERVPDGRRAAIRASIAASITATADPAPRRRRPKRRAVLGAVVVMTTLTTLAAAALWQSYTPPETSSSGQSERPTEAHVPNPSLPEAVDPTNEEASLPPQAPTAETTARRRAMPPPEGADEIALIAEASQELRAGHSRRTLALLRRHERTFAHGLLEQEREALAIEALLRGHHDEAAHTRAARFFRRYPGSALGSRIRELTADRENTISTQTP